MMTYGQYQRDQDDHHDHDQIHEKELLKKNYLVFILLAIFSL